MDDDDDLDAVVGVEHGNNCGVWWMENDGTGTGWAQHTVYPTRGLYYGDGSCAEDFDFDGKVDIASGYRQLAWFRQIGPNSFISYLIDNPFGETTRWVVPIRLGSGTCFQKRNVDILVCWDEAFVLYENNMISNFGDGWLESSVLSGDCDGTLSWLYFGWETCCPFSDAISFQVRSGTCYLDIIGSAWSQPIVITLSNEIDSVSLSSYTSSGDALFQYRVSFVGLTDAGIVEKVWVTYSCSPTNVEDKFTPREYLKVYPNRVCYSLMVDSDVLLSLYNVAGRLVTVIDKGKRREGKHWVTIPSIVNGIYFVVLETNGRRYTQKLLSIK